jgi:hypothetical protein
MAKIYAAWEGDTPLRVDPIAVRPIDDLIAKLNLQRSNRKGPLTADPPTFRIDPSKPHLDEIRGPAAVYVQIEEAELAALKGWESGWYLVILTPNKVRQRLNL